MSDWRILTGRWQDVLDVDRVDHVITDPPYSEHVHGKSRAGKRKEALRDGNGKLSPCAYSREAEFGFDPIKPRDMEELADLTFDICQRWSLTFCDSESLHLWAGAYRSAGLEHVRNGIWLKVGATPQFTGDRPGVGFEGIEIAHKPGRKRWNGGGKVGIWSALTVIERGGQRRTNNSREHPTQKPIDLMMQLISDFTDPGDTILDPYCGSASTGVACLRLGRNFIGVEQNEVWAEMGRERMRAEDEGSSLRERKAGQLPMFGAKP